MPAVHLTTAGGPAPDKGPTPDEDLKPVEDATPVEATGSGVKVFWCRAQYRRRPRHMPIRTNTTATVPAIDTAMATVWLLVPEVSDGGCKTVTDAVGLDEVVPGRVDSDGVEGMPG